MSSGDCSKYCVRMSFKNEIELAYPASTEAIYGPLMAPSASSSIARAKVFRCRVSKTSGVLGERLG